MQGYGRLPKCTTSSVFSRPIWEIIFDVGNIFSGARWSQVHFTVHLSAAEKVFGDLSVPNSLQ